MSHRRRVGQFVAAQEPKFRDPKVGLFAEGLCDDRRIYAVDTLVGIPEKYLFDAPRLVANGFYRHAVENIPETKLNTRYRYLT